MKTEAVLNGLVFESRRHVGRNTMKIDVCPLDVHKVLGFIRLRDVLSKQGRKEFRFLAADLVAHFQIVR